MFFVFILIPIYLIAVILAKHESTWKLAFRDGAVTLFAYLLFTFGAILAAGLPVLLSNLIFGENSDWASVFGTIGALAAFAAYAGFVSKKFPFF